ncbi:MAG: asparagine synthase (glutamine-hydrolyzing) [Anaerolineae bacterium]
MCGIAGIIRKHGPIDRTLLQNMCHAIQHRGPDNEGFYVNDGPPLSVGLGSRRLSIIDLSTAGHMPISNETGDVWIVYNGELYNHQPLREELLARGHIYQSNTDTETIVHAYEEYGLDCLNKFNGMFAFALFDLPRNRVVIARDPMGIKPIYYRVDDETILFASELRGLKPALPELPTIDPSAVSLYLSLGYIPSPYCIYQGIRKLQPGAVLVIDRERTGEHIYWTPQIRQTSASVSGINGLVADVRSLVEDAVSRQLMSDVPVGVFLSGGLDSSIVTALAQKYHGDRMDTFSVGFGNTSGGVDPDDLYNQDLIHAREVSAALGTRHHEIVVPTDSRITEHYLDTMSFIDEPLWETSFVSLNFMSRLAHDHGVKVVLTGDGGDELFAGYPWYFGAQRFERMQRVPFLQHALPFLQAVGRNRTIGEKARDLRIRLRQDDVGRYRTNHDIFPNIEKQNMMLVDGLVDPVDGHIRDLYERSGATTWGERLAMADLTLWVREHFNQRVDRMTMMHSIEARVPLQDQTVVEFALGIPLALKLHTGQSKYLLRKAFADILPVNVLTRPKRPFSVPTWTWLRGPMKEFTRDTLSRDSVRTADIVDSAVVESIVSDFMAGNDRLAFKVWTLLNLHAWHQTTCETAQN